MFTAFVHLTLAAGAFGMSSKSFHQLTAHCDVNHLHQIIVGQMNYACECVCERERGDKERKEHPARIGDEPRRSKQQPRAFTFGTRERSERGFWWTSGQKTVLNRFDESERVGKKKKAPSTKVVLSTEVEAKRLTRFLASERREHGEPGTGPFVDSFCCWCVCCSFVG